VQRRNLIRSYKEYLAVEGEGIPKLPQAYHHHDKWEEFHAGLWKTVSGELRNEMFQIAIRFMNDTDAFGFHMEKALTLWPISCEQNFTNSSINHIAWLGHAAVCIAHGIPEDITRLAWHELSEQKQDAANIVSAKYVNQWKREYAKKLFG